MGWNRNQPSRWASTYCCQRSWLTGVGVVGYFPTKAGSDVIRRALEVSIELTLLFFASRCTGEAGQCSLDTDSIERVTSVVAVVTALCPYAT